MLEMIGEQNLFLNNKELAYFRYIYYNRYDFNGFEHNFNDVELICRRICFML